MRVLILDNYDSFTFNLYQFVGALGADPIVRRNDEILLREIPALGVDRIIISPGPGRPDEPTYFGVCSETLLALGPTLPTLGVCLGHQGVIHSFGGRVVRAKEAIHGKSSAIYHDGTGLFSGIASPFTAMRYHSLVGDMSTLPECLIPTATTADGMLMAVRHRRFPVFGVQFHPESVGTAAGMKLLENFLSL